VTKIICKREIATAREKYMQQNPEIMRCRRKQGVQILEIW